MLQAFYGVRSERQLREQVTYNMLFRWFIGLSMDAPVWDVTVFTKNRERLLDGDVAVSFLVAVMGDPAVKRLLSTEHFSVDGTLIDAWASMNSFRRKDGADEPPAGPGRNAERTSGARSAATRRMPPRPIRTPGSIARRRPALAAVLHGAPADGEPARPDRGRANHARDRPGGARGGRGDDPAATRGRRATLGADKAYDAAEHIARLRAIGVTPHVAQNTAGRRSAIDGRTTRHAGYAASQRLRKRIEEPFGWIKAAAGLRKTRHRGLARVGWVVTLTAAACNLVRLPKLLAAKA